MTSRLPEEIVPDNDQTRARRQHLEAIQELVGNAYPNKFERSRVTKTDEREDTITSIVGAFRQYEPKVKQGERPTPEELTAACAEMGEPSVRISGRLATPPRVMGKAAFVHLSDGRERLQIYVKKQEAVAVSNDSLQPVEEAESGWKLFQLLDHGDFVGVEGKLFVTKTGELSVHVQTIQFLSKALLPLPDKLHGINDPEIRQRQRYADLIASSLKVKTDEEAADSQPELSTREVFERRSKLITALRRHLDDHGYIEVETPMLSPIASGAAARPFKTHHNALDIDLYLRIAPELYLKRLLVGGFERVYELNRNFRNEGISTRHNPEFTMLEFYTAYKDVNWMMDFCEEMIKTTIKTVNDSTPLHFAEHELDFDSFRRLSMKEAIAEYWREDLKSVGGIELNASAFDNPLQAETIYLFLNKVEEAENNSLESQRAFALEDYRQHKNSLAVRFALSKSAEEYANSYTLKYIRQTLITEKFKNRKWEEAQQHAASLWNKEPFPSEQTARRIVEMFERVAESHLVQPTFIYDFPKSISPLSKASPDNPAIAERFELYVAGMEVANGFSELNDPAEQLERFEEQGRQREGGDEEAMQMDEDYVKALSYGMPPAAGIGIGIDRLTMLLTNRRSIRDVILFPHMRPRAAQAEDSDEQAGNP